MNFKHEAAAACGEQGQREIRFLKTLATALQHSILHLNHLSLLLCWGEFLLSRFVLLCIVFVSKLLKKKKKKQLTKNQKYHTKSRSQSSRPELRQISYCFTRNADVFFGEDKYSS